MLNLDLVVLARSLDQVTPETAAEVYNRLFAELSTATDEQVSTVSKFTLRWLLKQMAGVSPEAEMNRRWPCTWNIIACIFQRVDLFPLAKALADRKFMSILQQTATDLSKPGLPLESGQQPSPVPSDEKNSMSKKRRRTDEIRFSLVHLKQPRASLQSAEAMFMALRILASRIALQSSLLSTNDAIGVEHIKSLFSTSSADAMDILAPLMTICAQALDQQFSEPIEHQDEWISIIALIYDLQSQGVTNASRVANQLVPLGAIILGRVMSILKLPKSALDTKTERRWAMDLQRFLTHNFASPARSKFLHKQDNSILESAIGPLQDVQGVRSCILFYIVLQTPKPVGTTLTKLQYTTWIEQAFDTVMVPLHRLEPEQRNRALSYLLHLAAEHKVTPSLETLRKICGEYALAEDKTDWQILAAVAAVDADALIASSQGQALLDSALERLQRADKFDRASYQAASNFAKSLGHGYANARDLSTFITRWARMLSNYAAEKLEAGMPGMVLASFGLRQTVAGLLQTALSPRQTLSLLTELNSENPPITPAAQLIILDAISAGVDLEEYIDFLGDELSKQVLRLDPPMELPASILSLKWRVLCRLFQWADADSAVRLWKGCQTSLRQMRKLDSTSCIAFEALKCVFAAVQALEFCGKEEEEAKTHLRSQLNQLRKTIEEQDDNFSIGISFSDAVPNENNPNEEKGAKLGDYVAWIMDESSRVIE
jgi:nucleolar pre-ribosomal-associated protein 2